MRLQLQHPVRWHHRRQVRVPQPRLHRSGARLACPGVRCAAVNGRAPRAAVRGVAQREPCRPTHSSDQRRLLFTFPFTLQGFAAFSACPLYEGNSTLVLVDGDSLEVKQARCWLALHPPTGMRGGGLPGRLEAAAGCRGAWKRRRTAARALATHRLPPPTVLATSLRCAPPPATTGAGASRRVWRPHQLRHIRGQRVHLPDRYRRGCAALGVPRRRGGTGRQLAGRVRAQQAVHPRLLPGHDRCAACRGLPLGLRAAACWRGGAAHGGAELAPAVHLRQARLLPLFTHAAWLATGLAAPQATGW